MVMNSEAPAVSPLWMSWLLDFRTAAHELIKKTTAKPSNEDATELQSMRFALYARALSLFDTACLLAQNDKLLNLRISCRGITECAIHMAASQSNPGYVKAVKDDDNASRRSRAKAFSKRQVALDNETRELLEKFLKGEFGGAKRLQPSDLAAGSEFPRLAHVYREISADAAHVTYTSLVRHFSEDADGTVIFICDPALTAEELHETLTVIALSGLVCTFLLVRNLPNFSDGPGFEAFQCLATRYKLLYRNDPCIEAVAEAPPP